MLNDFYQVEDFVTNNKGLLTCTISFNAAHPIFDGHFPGKPIVPGVCTIAIIGKLLSGTRGHKVILEEAASIKYLQLITPEISPLVNISWTQQNGLLRANATLKYGVQTLFKMSAKYVVSSAIAAIN